LKDVEEKFLKNSEFVASNDKITVADISLVILLNCSKVAYDHTTNEALKKYEENVKKVEPKLIEFAGALAAQRIEVLTKFQEMIKAKAQAAAQEVKA